jgi:hypothetical protein
MNLPPVTESESLPPSLLGSGIGLRLVISGAACYLLWLSVFWALR